MVALAQVPDDLKVIDDPSILRIYTDRDAHRVAASDITNWDLFYLKALYSSRGDVAWAEQSEIYNRFMKMFEMTAPH